VQRFAFAHRRRVQTRPDDALVCTQEANFSLEQLLLARSVAPIGNDALTIFRMDGLAPVGAQRLIEVQPGYLVICGVGIDAFARRIGNEDSEWRRIADRAK
jgi:hypothetical protein